MSLIKFPSAIAPDRVTVSLLRVDETFVSPATGAQQVVSRGSAAWKWSYEFRDISESERDIVQAFLMKCKGSLNTFKVTDPGYYQMRGSVSNWLDIFSGRGSFVADAGSASNAFKINSWWVGTNDIDHHITEEGTLLQAWQTRAIRQTPTWYGEGDAGKVSSLDLGKAYVQRIKYSDNPTRRSTRWLFRINSGGSGGLIQSGPATRVVSADSITVPFYVGANVSSYTAQVRNYVGADMIIGDSWGLYDYRMCRVGLVSNSENLLTYSNEFNHADWIATAPAVVTSGYSNEDPTGVSSGAWKLWANASVNTQFTIRQNYTKLNTGEIYTFSLYAKAAEYDEICLQADNGNTADRLRAFYNLTSGSVASVVDAGTCARGYADIFALPNSWYRLQLTGFVNSDNLVRARIFMSDGGVTQFTGVVSQSVEIYGAQLRKFPFMGQYVPTTTLTVVGTGWQTGGTMVVDGFDPGDILKSGQRFEVVNRFYNVNSNYFERSEFKRLTSELKANNEGSLLLEFEPNIRNAPVTDRTYLDGGHLGETMHNPVIFHKPEMKARLMGGTIQYIEKPLMLTDIVFDVFEDLTT